MSTSSVEPRFGRDSIPGSQTAAARLAPDLSKVLVVGNSQINRVVVSRIVERSGLRPASETPLTALRVLPLMFPGLVILDGGADNLDCQAVIGGIAALRRISGNTLPAVIMLSTRNGDPGSLELSQLIDAVVTKPFTTDQLQPVVDRLVDKARKYEVSQS